MYKILNNDSINKFIKDNYIDILNSIIENNYDKITIQDDTRIISDGNKEKQEIHQRRILRNYILPIIYLIYSFIYIKYYNIQSQRIISYENKIYYNMYLYFFSYDNLIIKKSNIFLYKYFNKKVNSNKLKNSDLDLSIKDKLIDNKDKISDFIDFIILDIKKKNYYDEQIKIYKDIIDNLKEIDKNINDILSNFLKFTNEDLILKNIKNNKDRKLKYFLDKIKSKDKFKLYGNNKLFYRNIFDKYKIILNYLNKINLQIINLNFYGNNKLEFFNENDISNIFIKQKKEYLDTLKNEITTKNDNEKNIIDYFKIIKNNFKEKKDIYSELFIQKNNNLKIFIKSFIEEIEKIKENDKTSSDNLLNLPSNQKNDFIPFFLESLKINQNIEYTYISNFIHNSIFDEKIINNINIIKDKKIKFNIQIRKFLKENNKEKIKSIIDKLSLNEIEIKKNRDTLSINSNNIVSDVPNSNITDKEIEINDLEKKMKDLKKDEDLITKIDESIKSKNIIEIFVKNTSQIFGNAKNTSNKLLSSSNNLSKFKIQNNSNKIDDDILKNLLNSFRNRFIRESDKYNKIKDINLSLLDQLTNIIKNNYKKLEKNYLNYLQSESQSKVNEFNNKFIFEKIWDIKKKLEDDIEFNKEELDKVKIERDNLLLDKYKFELYTFNENNKTEYLKNQNIYFDELITNIQNKINEKTIEIDNEITYKKELKDKYNDMFNLMYDESKSIEDTINIYHENNSKNKINYYYDKDKLFHSIIYKDINSKEFTNYTNKISNYFAKNKNDFITKILELKDKNENLKSLLDQYNEYYLELVGKIKNILNKINIGRIKLVLINNNNKNTKSTTNFNQIIESKINKKKEIINNSEKNNKNNNQKGEYTIILPYTDIMLLFFIELLIIIDYLTYFYE